MEMGTNMKKEQCGYKEIDFNGTCYECHHSYAENMDTVDQKFYCHVFQDQIAEFATCNLWTEHIPEADPL